MFFDGGSLAYRASAAVLVLGKIPERSWIWRWWTLQISSRQMSSRWISNSYIKKWHINQRISKPDIRNGLSKFPDIPRIRLTQQRFKRGQEQGQ